MSYKPARVTCFLFIHRNNFILLLLQNIFLEFSFSSNVCLLRAILQVFSIGSVLDSPNSSMTYFTRIWTVTVAVNPPVDNIRNISIVRFCTHKQSFRSIFVQRCVYCEHN